MRTFLQERPLRGQDKSGTISASGTGSGGRRAGKWLSEVKASCHLQLCRLSGFCPAVAAGHNAVALLQTERGGHSVSRAPPPPLVMLRLRRSLWNCNPIQRRQIIKEAEENPAERSPRSSQWPPPSVFLSLDGNNFAPTLEHAPLADDGKAGGRWAAGVNSQSSRGPHLGDAQS